MKKKVLGLGLGMLMLGGVVGAVSASGNAAKANTEAVQTREIEVYSKDENFDFENDSTEFFSDDQIDNIYAGAKEEFRKMSFEEQKKGMIEFLNYSIDCYKEDAKIIGEEFVRDVIRECEEELEVVKNAKSSADLMKIVDMDERAVNFLIRF